MLLVFMHHRGATLGEQCINGLLWHIKHGLLVTAGLVTAVP